MAEGKTEEAKAEKDKAFDRSFQMEDSEDVYYIKPPTGEDVRQADWHYAKMFNQALKDGFLTSSEILNQLKERKVVGDDYEQDLSDLQGKITEKLIYLEGLPEDQFDERRELALEISKLRGELYEMNHRVNGPLSNSCENLAEDARLSYLTSKVVVKEDESLIWESFDEFQQDRRSTLVAKSKFEVMLWLQGLPSDFISSLPENKVIEEAREQLISNIVSSMDMSEEEPTAEEGKKEPEADEKKAEPVPEKKPEKEEEQKDLISEGEEKPKKKKRGRPKKKKVEPKAEDVKTNGELSE